MGYTVEDAMSSVTYIMNDDLDSAEAHLNKGSSSFHQVRIPHTRIGCIMWVRVHVAYENSLGLACVCSCEQL